MARIDLPGTDDLCRRVALGTGRFQTKDLEVLYATLIKAYDLGIRHFDTSVLYSDGDSQAVVGRFLRDVKDPEIFVSTKIGHFLRSFPGWWSLHQNEDALWAQVHECNRLLRGRIDLLQIHEADTEVWWSNGQPEDADRIVPQDFETPLEGFAAARILERAKSSGICGFTGITGNSSKQLAQVSRLLPTDSVMCAYNLDPIFREAAKHALPLAQTRGSLAMAAGVLQGAAYRDPLNVGQSFHRDPRLPAAFARFAAIQRESGLGWVELLERWSLSAPFVDRWVVGATEPTQIEQIMISLRKGPLPQDLQDALDGLEVEGLDRSMLLELPD